MPSPSTRLFGWSIASFVVLFVLGNLVVGAGAWLGDGYAWVAASSWRLVPAVGIVLVAGRFAFGLMKRHRRYYGALEVGAAAATIAHVLAHPIEPMSETAALVTSIYFFVRGLSNMETAASAKVPV